jgi:hypothetical protein
MMNNYYLCIAGGAGAALATDACLRGIPVFAVGFAVLALICLTAGWLGLRDADELRLQVENAERRANQAFDIANRRSSEAAHYLHALLEVRELLATRLDAHGALAVAADAITDFENDPAVAVQLCINWLTALRLQQIDDIGLAPIAVVDQKLAGLGVTTKLDAA